MHVRPVDPDMRPSDGERERERRRKVHGDPARLDDRPRVRAPRRSRNVGSRNEMPCRSDRRKSFRLFATLPTGRLATVIVAAAAAAARGRVDTERRARGGPSRQQRDVSGGACTVARALSAAARLGRSRDRRSGS